MPKCKICKELFVKIRPLQPTCNKYECKVSYATNVANKAIERKKKAQKKELKENINKLKPKSYFENILQKEINLIARLIDFGQPCIATGNYGKMNGGHFHAVKSCPQIRYNLHNVHIQSFHSNHFKSGDNVKYRQGLIDVYGTEYAEYVENLKGAKSLQLSIVEIKEATKKARQIKGSIEKIKRAEKDRIELRDKINIEIGIYQ